MSMNETSLRRKDRKKLNQNVIAVDALRDLVLGHLANLHEEGFMLIAGSGIAVNHLYQVEFQLSQAIKNIKKIKIGVECLWLNETGSDEHFWAGFQIIDMSESDKIIINQLVCPVMDDDN